MKRVAVILAGGTGSRFGADIPKQFLSVNGRTLLEYTVSIFEQNPHIDEIAIVAHPDYVQYIREDLFPIDRHPLIKRVLRGGKNRYDSSLAAIAVYEDEDRLLFHDAVRPLLSQTIINQCILALNEYDAIDVAIPTTDTIIQVNNQCIIGIPPRASLWNGQTPQCFKRSVIKAAYDIALRDPDFVTTDDCGVVHKYLPQIPVYVVQGEVMNMKITHQEDIKLFESYLNDSKR